MVCISHLNSPDTFASLLRSLERTPRVARALRLLVITASKTGRLGRVCAVRELAPLSSHLIHDHSASCNEAYFLGLATFAEA